MTDETNAVLDEQEIEAQMPKPVGYRLLVALAQVEETFNSMGIIKAERTMYEEQLMTVTGVVLDMGAQAYSDKERFPNGPWCNVGDFVLFRATTGTRIRVNGVEYRLMNDDSIEAVVADPRGITRG